MASILSLKNVTIEYNKENLILKYFSKLRKYFNRTNKAVKNVSFELEEGKVLGIIGESGSGKSSLAKAIVGLINISKGEIIYKNTKRMESNTFRYTNDFSKSVSEFRSLYDYI